MFGEAILRHTDFCRILAIDPRQSATLRPALKSDLSSILEMCLKMVIANMTELVCLFNLTIDEQA